MIKHVNDGYDWSNCRALFEKEYIFLLNISLITIMKLHNLFYHSIESIIDDNKYILNLFL